MGAKHTLSGKTRTVAYSRNGVDVIELLNSPRRHLDFHCDPRDHLMNAAIEQIAVSGLDDEKPDIVHVHDPRLLTVSVIDLIKARDIPVIKTVHNYFDICPQAELMFKGDATCTDFEDGAKCRVCMTSMPEESFVKEKISNSLRGTFIHPHLKKLWRSLRSAKNGPHARPGESLLPFPAESYRKRRSFCIERLNMIDAVHCYSRRSAEVLVDYGVKRSNVVVLPISSDSIKNLYAAPEKAEPYPVVFGYLTGASHLKGYEYILEAFSRLDQRKARLVAYGFDEPDQFRERYKSLNAEFHGAYKTDSLNEILSVMDVGLVPSIWEEVFGIVGLEFHAAGLPVIGSNIGGIPEWLDDQKTGLLVRARDSEDLYHKMARFVDNPTLISEYQHNIKPWKSMDEHVSEVQGLYERLL
jgi:glycosyltransferase involved in cell wall biosynthesis